MSGLPVTRILAGPEKEAAIRNTVRNLKGVDGPNGLARIATLDDVDALREFLALPEVSDPIYTIEKPVTRDSVKRQIETSLTRQKDGTGFLCAIFNEDGRVISYLDFIVWPEWSTAEFAGAMRPSQQSMGRGKLGIVANVDWSFNTLGVDRMCFTAALDNIRSIKVIDNLGGERMGEIDSVRSDGTTRRSLVWEVTAEAWQIARKRLLGDSDG